MSISSTVVTSRNHTGDDRFIFQRCFDILSRFCNGLHFCGCFRYCDYLFCNLFLSLQGKLRHLKAEACWVLSPSDPLPASCHSLRTLWRRAHPKTRFQPLRSRVRTTGARVKIVARREKQQVRPLESPGKRSQKQGSRTSPGKTSKLSDSSGLDEIEDIFSSLDF